MLQTMAFFLVLTVTALLCGAAEIAVVAGLLLVATPFACIGWHILFARPGHEQ